MSEKRDGGPAFPRPASIGNNYVTGERGVVVDPQKGMALRDWFAGQALVGALSRDKVEGGAFGLAELWAGRAYELADAMLAEREKGTK